MIDVNMGGFKQNLDFFVTESQNNKINQKADRLTSSSGEPIRKINYCLSSYDKYCENIDKVYHSTMLYLQKAYYNTSACESDNTV